MRFWFKRRPLRGASMANVPGGRAHLAERKVRVRPFKLDLRPVTNADWLQFVHATGARCPAWMHRPGWDDPEQPVVGVRYDEALAYARWAGKRLPTEAEWVRAARGAARSPYPWGDENPTNAMAHFGRGARGAPAPLDGEVRPAGRGPWGHIDLCGNVWEWCRGGALRGGFWGGDRVDVDHRLIERRETTSGGFGFRCAK